MSVKLSASTFRLPCNQASRDNVGDLLRGTGQPLRFFKNSTAILQGAIFTGDPNDGDNLVTDLAEGVGAISLAVALLKLPGLIASLGSKSLAWLRNAEAIGAETKALQQNTVETEKNNVVKETSPVPALGEGAAAAGTAKRGFLSTEGAGRAIGLGSVALEAGLILIQKWEAAQNAAIDRVKQTSEADSQDILSMQEQIELAETAKQKDEARVKLKKEIADLDARIADNKTSDFVEDGRGGGAFSDTNPDETNLLLQRRLLKQHQLDTFDDNAGSDAEGARQRARDAVDKQDNANLKNYHESAGYKLEEAEQGGNQDQIDDAKYAVDVEKLTKHLEEQLHISHDRAEKEAEIAVSAKDQAKEAQALSKELERVTAQVEKQKDAATLHADLLAKQAELLKALPAGTGSDVGSLAGAVQGLPQGDEAEIARKSKLVELLKEILTLTKEAESADKKDEAAGKKSDDEATRRNEAIASAKEEIAINEARARGENDVANALEKQRDVRREIKRLQDAGVDAAQAQATAEQEINAQNDAQDAKDAARAGRHVGRSERDDDRGRRGFTIHGYRDGDTGGGLHTGGLTSGGLTSGGGLDTSAGAALASAATYMPSFPGARTATDGFAPAFAAAPQVALGTGVSGGNDPLSAAANKFGGSAQSGLDKAAGSIDKLSQTIISALSGFAGRIDQVEGNVRQVQAQVSNHA